MSKRKTYTARELAGLKRRRFTRPDVWECAVTVQDIEVGRHYSFFEFPEDEFAVGEVMRADTIVAIYDYAAREQAAREDQVKRAKDERKRAGVEAQKAAAAKRAAVPTYHKRSPSWWREALDPLTEKCSGLTLD
jgi:hypothetical protein